MYNDNIAIAEYSDYIAETWEAFPSDDDMEAMYNDAVQHGYIAE